MEYLLGILSGGSFARAAMGALFRNFGTTRPRTPDEPSAPEVTLHPGKQDKHIVGTNNYQPGRSILLADPHRLLRQFAGRGKPANNVAPGAAGYKERFDTGGEVIGIYKNPATGEIAETTTGIIHYGKDGTAHIVPAEPVSR